MRRLTILLAAVAMAVSLVGVGSATGKLSLPPPPIDYEPGLEWDAAVSTSTAPPAAVAGDFALLSSLIVNHGRNTATVSFTDSVPAGLAVNSVAAGSGNCNTSGQTVSCKVVIAPAESAPVNVIVTPAAAGSYSNKVSILPAEGQRDTNSSNDGASATLTVADAAAPALARPCRVPSLERTPAPIARRVLALLQCKPGKVKRAHSRGIAKGRVIRTTPKPGTYKQGRVVSLTVSSGPKKGKRHRR